MGLTGCASRPAEPAIATEPVVVSGIELPPGAGQTVLTNACLGCHDLGGLQLFKGFYNRSSWRDLVLTMRANGAQVSIADVEVLTDYLTEHFGPDAP